MDIQLIRKKLQTLYGNVVTADYRKAANEIKAFLNYLASETEIAKVISELPTNKVDIEDWMNNAWNQISLDLPENEQERVAFCIAVLEKYKDDPTAPSHNFHTGSNGFTDHVREYFDFFVPPVYQYIDERLHAKEIESSPVSNMSISANNLVMVQGHNYGTISQSHTEAIELIDDLAGQIASSSITEDEKRDAIANIDTIKSQLSSKKPNSGIIKLAWPVVAAAADIAGAIDLAHKIATLLGIAH